MKQFITLFFVLAIFGIAWGYSNKETRAEVWAVVKKNLLPIALAALAAVAALHFSINTTMRFL